MTTEFDAEAGILRLAHAPLAVLARLAVAPTDPSLNDHATAPPLAALRAAGIIGPAGIDPAVRPLAEVLGAPRATLDLSLEAGGATQRSRGWATRSLVVIAVPEPGGGDGWDLMAETVAQAPALIGDVMGLHSAPEAGAAVPAPADVAAVRARWRLTVRRAGGSEDVAAGRPEPLEVLEGAVSGLWMVDPPSSAAEEPPRQSRTDAAAVRARIAVLLDAALA